MWIECSTDNGSTYSTIAERVPNTGVFDWVVPPNYSPVCLIRISDAGRGPPAPNVFSLEFDLKVGPEAAAGGESTLIMVRVAVPNAESQTTYAADLSVLSAGPEAAEALRLNLAESAPLEIGSSSGEWRHFSVMLNMDNRTGSVAADGQPILEAVPLIQLPVLVGQPEVDISCPEGSSTKVRLENLELRYQDRIKALAEDGGALLRPLAKDAFDRYAAGAFPQYGGWILYLIASDGTLLPAGQVSVQDAALQSGVTAEIDEEESLSPTRSFRFEKPDPGSFTVVKRFAMPARLPCALSAADFSIISQETKLLQIKERIDAEKKRNGGGSSETDPEGGKTPADPQVAPGGGMSALTSVRTGTYYIYTFDGRLLAEYDIYGICLKEYIYMGSRLVAEFNPATSQYLYYTQDQIGSTRIVTDDTGAVVYAAAHDPFGGIQKVWVDAFDPERKFSDKERDGETGLDYFGARYYSAPNSSEGARSGSYRWLSIDPVLRTETTFARPQTWNLYSYCENNPVIFDDPDGRIVRCNDEAAFEALKRSLGNSTLSSKITWDRVTGVVSVEDIESDDDKFNALKMLVESDTVFTVALTDSVEALDATQGYEPRWFSLGEQGGMLGLMITPKDGRPSPPVRNSDGILIAVARKYFRNNKLEQARTLAEELYGHAFLYAIGLPYLHDLTPDRKLDRYGPVNQYCIKIRESIR